MRRPLLWLTATAGISLVLAGGPASSLAASPPTIGNFWVSGVAQSDATLQAEVNPEDPSVGVYYQFQVVAHASEFLSEIACPPRAELKGSDGCGPGPEVADALPIGFIEHGTETRTVHVDLADAGMTLQPDTTYRYRLLAARKVPTEDIIQWEPPAVVGSEGTFTTLATGRAPKVESESVSHLTSQDATLEAQIDTEGLAAEYQFNLTSSPCSKHGAGCELVVTIPLPSGKLLGSFVDQAVSLDLNSVGVRLGEGEYHYSLTATSKGGSTYGLGQTFEAPRGVFEPGGPATTPQSVDQAATSTSGDQTAGSTVPSGSGTTSSTASSGQASSPGVATTGTSSHGTKGKHQAKHAHHHKKPVQYHAQAKRHKR